MSEKSKTKGFDSRQHLRVPCKGALKLVVSPKMRKVVNLLTARFSGDVLDISIQGMGIVCNVFLPKGIRVQGTIDGKAFDGTHQSKTVRFVGIVMNSRMSKGKGYRVGIRFERLTDRNKAIIEVHVQKHSPQSRS